MGVTVCNITSASCTGPFEGYRANIASASFTSPSLSSACFMVEVNLRCWRQLEVFLSEHFLQRGDESRGKESRSSRV